MTNLRGGFKRKPLSSMPETIIETVRRDKTIEDASPARRVDQLMHEHGMTRALAKAIDFAERHPPTGLGGPDTITVDESCASRQPPLAAIDRVARYTAVHDAIAMSVFGFSATTRKLPGR